MRTLKNILTTTFVLLLFGSCQKEIDIEFSEFKSRIVVNGIFSPEEPWEIILTNSRNILDPDSKIEGISEASVVIKDLGVYEEGEEVEDIILTDCGNGCYRSVLKPKLGTSYSLQVTKTGYSTVYATSNSPQLQEFSYLDASSIDTSSVEIDGKLALQVDFSISDNLADDNYYIYDLLVEDENGEELGGFHPSANAAWLSSLDLNVDPTLEDVEYQSKLFITDVEFSGQEYKTTFFSFNDVIQRGFPADGSGEVTLPKIKLRVLTVSKELYKYFKSVEDFLGSQSVNTTSVDPAEIKSNVVNGLGIFGSFNQQMVDI